MKIPVSGPKFPESDPGPSSNRLPAGPGRRAALAGLGLVAAQAAFLVSMLMKHEFGVELRVFDLVGAAFEYLDCAPLTHPWFSPVAFGLLPLAAFLLNIRSIVHAAYSSERRLLTLVVEAKPANLAALILAAGVLGAVFLYQLAETFLAQG